VFTLRYATDREALQDLDRALRKPCNHAGADNAAADPFLSPKLSPKKEQIVAKKR
jgi:hypothetical protein